MYLTVFYNTQTKNEKRNVTKFIEIYNILIEVPYEHQSSTLHKILIIESNSYYISHQETEETEDSLSRHAHSGSCALSMQTKYAHMMLYSNKRR